jgi:hypothetical protein
MVVFPSVWNQGDPRVRHMQYIFTLGLGKRRSRYLTSSVEVWRDHVLRASRIFPVRALSSNSIAATARPKTIISDYIHWTQQSEVKKWV